MKAIKPHVVKCKTVVSFVLTWPSKMRKQLTLFPICWGLESGKPSKTPCRSKDLVNNKYSPGDMNRSKTANDLLTQIILETKADILLISEQYKNRDDPTWNADRLGTAAIWVPDPSRVCIDSHGAGDGFVWIKSGNTTYVTCYFTPNERIADFRAKLDGLEDAIRSINGDLIVAGDFNAKALEWGADKPASKGRYLMEVASRLDLIVLNKGLTFSFRRPGYRETIIDVSFASEGLATFVMDLKVNENYSASDHQYITFCIANKTRASRQSANRPPRWNINLMDEGKLSDAINERIESLDTVVNELGTTDTAETLAETIMKIIRRTCQKSILHKRPRNNRQPVYWWTEEIAALRKKCLYARRRA